jgi:hypothetical protein
LGISGIVFIIILVNTAAEVGWSSGYWWHDNGEYVAGAIFHLVLFGLVLASGSEADKHPPASPFFNALFGK